MPRGSSCSRSSSRTNLPAKVPPPPPKPETESGLLKTGGAVAGGVLAGNLLSAAFLTPREGGQGQEQRPEKPVDPCAKELKNFIDCSRTVNDLSLCEGFNKALNACRKENGPPPPP